MRTTPAVPRRPGRQSPAPGRAARGARPGQGRRHLGRTAPGGGRPLHPRGGSQAGSAGTARRHRRRVPARLLAPRLPPAARGGGPGAHQRRGVPGRGRAADAHGHRQRALRRSDHGRPLPVSEIGGEGRAQVHHPGPGHAAPARRPERHLARALSGPRRVLGGRRRPPIARRSDTSPPPGARISSSTT